MLVTLALACGIAGAVAAAEMTGTVVSADAQSITIRHDDGTQQTHSVAPGVTVRDESGTPLRPMELANRRVQVEVDDQSRVTSIELADADEGEAAAPGADPMDRTAQPEAEDRMDDPADRGVTGTTEERAAQAGDPAADDPAGGEMARTELPDTAGPVTLVALVGGALLAAAYATRAYRKR
jgi:hypothetical protein